MKVPSWLLRLLPIWDYICPRCKKEVGKQTDKCPHCQEKYGEPLRVPPHILGNKKSLEEYVHKHVFPIISKAQREYLARYFTTLFSDGFESGDLTAWSATSTTTGETVAASQDLAHHGTWSVKCTSNGGGGSEAARVQNTVNYASVYVRGYIYVATNGIDAASDYMMFIGLRAGTNELGTLGWYNNAGTLSWWLRCRNDTSYVSDYDTTVTRNTGEWYCIEIYWENAASANVYGWVNGNQTLSLTARDTNNYGNIDTIWFGLGLAYNCASNVVYGDCFITADAYIGPEVARVACRRLMVGVGL